MKLVTVVGTRPNFIQAAPIHWAVEKFNSKHPKEPIENVLVHTGQHYDAVMTTDLSRGLQMPQPNHSLGIGSGSHAEQIGRTIVGLDPVLSAEAPDWVITVGDVNAILAAAVVAKRLFLKLAHVESGMRSGDWAMPEEQNRVLVDRVADLLFAPTEEAAENLRKENTESERIAVVGNIMVDALEEHLKSAQASPPESVFTAAQKKTYKHPKDFAVLTIHRPENVDARRVLKNIVAHVERISKRIPVAFPVHPRTEKRLREFKLMEWLEGMEGMLLLRPLDYLEMLTLMSHAKAVITDSGSMQDETTVLGVPCLTLRTTTERPVTLRENGGTNVLIGHDLGRLEREFEKAQNAERKPFRPPFWDGRTAERIVETLYARREEQPYRTQSRVIS